MKILGLGKDKKGKPGGIWIAVVILMPLIIVGIMAFINVVFRASDPFPGIVWNDEAVYLKLIETYSKFSSPPGYWGFDANHAILGSGPAWSPAILIPYAVIARFFPAGQSFVFFVNLFFIVLANIIFVLLVDPDREECINLAGFELLSVPVILYLTTTMSEIYRYAIAVVLAGMMFNLYRKKGTPILKYVLIPLFVIYAVQVYTFFAFAVPLYVCGLLKDKKWYVRFLASLPVTAVVAGGSYYFLHLISSNYNIGKTESLLAAISARDFTLALKSLFGMVKEGLAGVIGLKNYIMVYPLYPYSVILALLLIGIGIFFVLRGNKNPERKEDLYLGRMIAHSVSLYYLMYLTLYTIVPDTFYRGTAIVIIFSLYLAAMSKREYIVRLLLLVSLAGVFLMKPQIQYFTEHHYEASKVKNEWKACSEKLDEALEVDTEKSLWDNTVLMYTMEPKAICAVPVGLAQNYVLTDGVFSNEPGYLFFSKKEPEEVGDSYLVKSREDIMSEWGEVIEEEFRVIYEDDEYIVYKRNHL